MLPGPGVNCCHFALPALRPGLHQPFLPAQPLAQHRELSRKRRLPNEASRLHWSTRHIRALPVGGPMGHLLLGEAGSPGFAGLRLSPCSPWVPGGLRAAWSEHQNGDLAFL